MNQARLTGATVEAITTWQDPAQYGTAYVWTSAAFQGDTYATMTAKVLDETVAEVASGMAQPVTVLPLVPRRSLSIPHAPR